MTTAFDDLTPSELETLVGDVWEARGWQTTVSPDARDGGVDVVAERQNPYPEKVLIQVKHYADDNQVSAPEVQQYAGLHHQHGDADSVIVVTSGGFTSPAEETADDANVKLVGGDELAAMAADAGLLTADTGEDESREGSQRQGIDAREYSEPTGGEASASEQVEELIRLVVMVVVLVVMVYTLWEAGLLL